MEPILEIFADDSCIGDAVVYSFAAFNVADIDRLLDVISRVKKNYGGSHSTPVHCRSLFAPDARAKTEWKHLKHEQPYFLCRDLARAVKGVGMGGTIAYIDKKAAPEKMHLVFHDGSDAPTERGHPLFEKQLLTFAYQAGAVAMQQTFPQQPFRIWVRPDTTKIEWMNQKRQVKQLHAFVKPETGDAGKLNPLLDIADLVAYSAARHLNTKKRTHRLLVKWIFDAFSLNISTFKFRPEWWDPVKNADKLLDSDN